eukprot:Pgem_evm1s18694
MRIFKSVGCQNQPHEVLPNDIPGLSLCYLASPRGVCEIKWAITYEDSTMETNDDDDDDDDDKPKTNVVVVKEIHSIDYCIDVDTG